MDVTSYQYHNRKNGQLFMSKEDRSDMLRKSFWQTFKFRSLDKINRRLYKIISFYKKRLFG